MRFSKAAYNRFIANIGQQIQWRASSACPCLNPHSGASDPRCPLCTGIGRVWEPPVDVVVGIASQKTQERWAKFGMFEQGDIVIMIPEDSEMWDRSGQFDRVISMNSLDGFSEVLTHGAVSERLRYAVNSITRVWWRDPQDPRKVVEGGIPTLNERGEPAWTAGEPPQGVSYSINGDRFSEYFMVDGYPNDRNMHSGLRLPKNSVLRKWDLFSRSGRAPTGPA